MLEIIKNISSGILMDKAELLAVFSNNPDSEGIARAREMGLATHVIPSRGQKRSLYNAKLHNWLLEMDPDLIVLAGYMRIIPFNIIKSFPQRIINIHPADTALHQGLHGYEWAYHNKLEFTRITVHYVDEGLDTGSIIRQQQVDLKGAASLQEVERRGLAQEHKLYSQVLAEIISKNKDRKCKKRLQ